MRHRPIYLTIICWLALFGAVGGIYSNTVLTLDSKAMFASTSLPSSVWTITLLYLWLQTVGLGLAAWHMFRHRNWARWLFVGTGAFDLAWRFLIAADAAAFWIGAIYYAIIWTVLFLPESNAYFRSRRRSAG